MRRLATGALAFSVFICAVTIVVYIQCNKFELFTPGEFGIQGAFMALLFLGLPLGAVTGAACGYLHWKGIVPTWISLALSSLAILTTALLLRFA